MKRSRENRHPASKKTKYFEEPGELGIIESVSLRNFMCHENLKFDFDPHMNFIVGLNGSGKSAILTGIILALGGKSSATGRYANIKGFIKTGKQSATASVVLKNCGISAYKQEEFGNKIIIERTLNDDGVSQYKLKSETGRIVSTSKEELRNILDTMDIKIENPVTVLTQEISRNFLLQMKPEKLFTLFYKGTGLEKLQERYDNCFESTKNNEAEILKKNEILLQKEQDLKKLKMLLETAKKIDDLKNELLWAGVIEIERQKNEKKNAYEETKAASISLKQKLEQEKADIKEIDGLLVKYKKINEDCQEAMKIKRVDLGTLKSEALAIQNSIREFQGELNRNQRELQRKLQEIASLENMIAESRQRNERDIEKETQERLERISNYERELENLGHQLQDSATKEDVLCNEESNLEKRITVLRSEINESNYKIREVERQLEKIRAGMQQRINVYGPEMKQVLDDIEAADRRGVFTKRPIGPIGLYLHVKDERWSFALETFLKYRLKSFCCDNISDSQKLDDIFNKYYRGKKSPPINISKFQASHVHEVNKVQSSFPTVLDVLEIKNPVVANFLLDHHDIEAVLLIDDDEAARNLMMYNPPRGCKCAYTLNGDELRQDPFRHYSCFNRNTLGILKSLSQAELKGREEHLKIEKNEIKKKESMLCEVQRSLSEKKAEREEQSRQRTNLFSFKSNYERKLNDERCYEDPKDLNNLQGDLDQLMKEKSMFEAEIERVNSSLEKQNDELSKVNHEFQSKKTSLKKDQDESYSSSERVVTCENARENKRQAIQNLEASYKISLQDEKHLLDDFKMICKATEKAISNAEKVRSRIKTTKSAEMLRTLIQETTKAFDLASKQNRESVQQDYLEKLANLKKLKAEYSALEKKILTMKSMCHVRLKKMKEICDYTKLNLTLSFVTMLKENNFIGNIVVSFENKTLKIEAKPDKIGGKSANKQQTANLSGGERSYVTIAFLLALWDRIEMPFRILDEYDVFMDSDNRHLSVNLLIRNAENKKNMQFIFLTPQELPLIRNCPELKVHKMPAPKRN